MKISVENIKGSHPLDELIGDLSRDEDGRTFRMINGRKIYQIEERSQKEVEMNRIINLVRASGKRPFELM
jgi:hypothetical protein